MKKFLLLICLTLLTMGVSAQNKPFPQEESFPGTIKPANVTQVDMNQTVSQYFSYWNGQYVKQSNGVTSGGGFLLIKSPGSPRKP